MVEVYVIYAVFDSIIVIIIPICMRIKKSQRFLTEDDEKCSTFRITRFIDESPNKPINGKPYLKKYSKGQNGF